MGVPLDVTVRDRSGNVKPLTAVALLQTDGVTHETVYLDSALTESVTQPLYTDDNGQLSTDAGEDGCYWYSGNDALLGWFDGHTPRIRPLRGIGLAVGIVGGDLQGMLPNPAFSAARIAEIAGKLNTDDAGYLWRRHGVATGVFAGVQDTPIASLIAAIAATSVGGEMRPDYGDTMVNAIVVPENRAIRVKGYGSGWRSTGGAGTRLRRASANANPLLSCIGSGLTDTTRALMGVERLLLHGGRDAGYTSQSPLLQIDRWQQGVIDDIYCFQNDGVGLALHNIFNCHVNKVNITHCGSPALDAAALHIGAAGSDGTVRFLANNWHIEQNFYTDVRLGNPDNANGYVTEFVINGLSMEGGLDSSGVPNPIPYPYLHLGFAESGIITGLYIYCHRSVPPILSEHPAGGGAGADDAVKISGGGITQSSSVTNPDYFIDIQGGSVHFSNFYIRGKPNIAYIRIGANVRPGAVKWTDSVTTTRDGSTPPLLCVDQRPVPEFVRPL